MNNILEYPEIESFNQDGYDTAVKQGTKRCNALNKLIDDHGFNFLLDFDAQYLNYINLDIAISHPEIVSKLHKYRTYPLNDAITLSWANENDLYVIPSISYLLGNDTSEKKREAQDLLQTVSYISSIPYIIKDGHFVLNEELLNNRYTSIFKVGDTKLRRKLYDILTNEDRLWNFVIQNFSVNNQILNPTLNRLLLGNGKNYFQDIKHVIEIIESYNLPRQIKHIPHGE